MSTSKLHDATALLALAESGLKQITEGPDERRAPGVRNVLVFGGLFLSAMNALAKTEPLFASWLDVQKQPDGVEELRNAVLREPKSRVDYTKVELASAGREFGPRPANARAFFSGDRRGGTGWEIALPGGDVEKYYVVLTDPAPPDDAQAIAKRYVAHLREVLKHAKIAAQ